MCRPILEDMELVHLLITLRGPVWRVRILSGGTAYLTDAGMCGSFDSVLGVKKELAVEKMRTQLPTRFENARGQGILWGCVIDIDEKTGRARSIERVADRVE